MSSKLANSLLSYVLTILVACLISLSLYLHSRVADSGKSLIAMSQELDRITHQYSKAISYEHSSSLLEARYIEKKDSFILIDENGEISHVLNSCMDTLILLFHSKLNCSSCINSILGFLGPVDFLTSQPRLIFIADYDRKRDVLDFKRRSGIHDIPVYSSLNGYLADVYERYPFFVVHTDTRIEVFIPDKDQKERTENFLRRWNMREY